MTSSHSSLTSGLGRGQETESLKGLQAAGVTLAEYEALGRRSPIMPEVAAAIKKHRLATIAALFSSPPEQVSSMLELNDRLWHDQNITPDAIGEIGNPPECPPLDDDHLYCVCLLYDTGDLIETLMRNVQACAHILKVRQRSSWRTNGQRRSIRNHTGLHDDAISRPAGFSWAVVELGWQFNAIGETFFPENLARNVVRAGLMGIGQEGPLIAALHPRWARAMNGEDIPFLVMTDLVIQVQYCPDMPAIIRLTGESLLSLVSLSTIFFAPVGAGSIQYLSK